MRENIDTLVEQTIDAAIRSFQPGDQSSYDHWDAELLRVEKEILKEELLQDRREFLLAAVRARRIDQAYDVDKFDLVIERSSRFMRDFPASVPSYFVVAALRARSLHKTGSHDQEIEEMLVVARQEEISGSEFVFLLESLSVRHPGVLPSDTGLWLKMRDAVSLLRKRGYETLSEAGLGSNSLEEAVRIIAREFREISRAKAEEVLSGNPGNCEASK